MRNTTARTTALLTPPTADLAEMLTGPLSPVRLRAASRFSPAVPTVPTTRCGYPAAHGAPPDRSDGDRPTSCGRHVAAGGRPDGGRRPNRRTYRRSVLLADPWSRRRHCRGERER